MPPKNTASKTKKSTKTSTKAVAKTSTKTAVKSVKTPKRTRVQDTKVVVEEEVVNTPKPRRVVTVDSVKELGESLVTLVENEIETLKNSNVKVKGIKFLRSLNKNLKQYNKDVARLSKQRPASKRKSNENSGFKKPVRISEALSKFAGWKSDELHSRVEGTKALCNYIRENNLQNPENKKQIIPDETLSELLNYNDGEPELTYATMQKYLKYHYLPTE